MRIFEILRKNILLISLFFISSIIIIGSFLYYFWVLNNISYFILLFLSLISTTIFSYFIIYKSYRQEIEEKVSVNLKTKKINLLLFILNFFLFLFLVFVLIKSSSNSAIISPWHLVPNYFYLILALFLVLVFFSFYFQSIFSKTLVVFIYFLFFSISFFIYKIAFGYDQLLHQRALSEILQFGLINPKTFYYIGQYSLEFFLVKTLPFKLELISRVLVPVLSAILIPLSFFKVFKNKLKSSYYILILLLLLPFSIFTYTVPQNLAFLFLTILIIFSLNRDFVSERKNYIFLSALSLASFFVHPLAGVPAVIFVFILFLSNFRIIKQSFWQRVLKKENKIEIIRKTLIIISYLTQIFILPILLFFVGGKLSWPQINFSFLIPRFLGQENVFLNLIYFLFFNRFYIFLILFLVGIYFWFKKNKEEKNREDWSNIYFYNFLALFSSYILSLFVSFSFLSDIDKNSYSQRVLIISLLFLIPVFLNLFLEIIERVKKQEKSFKFYSLLFLLLFLLSSLYLNYPRKDNYFNSRGYSVSSSDFETVKLIEDVKINDNYIVLANQQVGAAAIKELGFKRYYDGWLYYSVQTGGLFYDYYLKMLDRPSRGLIEELLSQIEADNAYVVVNDYWWAYERIINEMKIEADSYYQTSDGKASIFHFRFDK
ncbi:MAG TPA: hypothetical protein PK686_00470 [bacterium]|nr:hypothetical protein [bacterium]HPV65142.1 hypothetical protein [bacterium]